MCVYASVRRSAKDENRKKQAEKKAAAPKKVAGANAPAVKMGKAGGAVIQPGRSSAPGNKSTSQSNCDGQRSLGLLLGCSYFASKSKRPSVCAFWQLSNPRANQAHI